MPKLPVVSGHELIRLLEAAGFRIVRQKGSHVSLQREMHRTVVPLHDELAKGTLLGILKRCGLTKEDLVDMVGEKGHR
jgi:predicted RNA binding protein YcfA (HicA-like mRNA interferase family)